MTDHTMMGVTLIIDRENLQAYLSATETANFFEADVRTISLNRDPKELAGSKYDALFTGEIVIRLKNYPCEINTISSSKLQALSRSINPNQGDLFKQSKEETPMATKGKVKQKREPAKDAGYLWFNPAEYEEAKAKGIKLLPPNLSRKNRGKWNNERREYEKKMGYPTSFATEKGRQEEDVKTEEEIKEEIVQESKELMDKDDKGLEAYIAAKDGLDVKDVEIIAEETIDIGKEMDADIKGYPKGWNPGDGNHIGVFGDHWNEGFFLGSQGSNNVYATVTTAPHPQNGHKYTVCTPKQAIAQFLLNQMEKHGNLSEQVDGARLLKISDALLDSQKEIPCLWVENAYNFLNSSAIA